jgi:hypothetical protein
MGAGFLSIALLLSFLASPGTTADSDRRLVLVESPASRLSKSGREHLRAAIGEVVTRRGLGLVPPGTLSERLLRCEPQDCLPQIAAASGATLVLRVEAKYAKESFKLAIELWNSDQGKLLGREERTCPICDEQDLWGSAALLVQGLLDRALQEPEAPVDKAGPTSPAAAPEPLAPPRVLPTATERQADRPGNLVGYSGLALTVAGASLLVAGVYYVAVDGKPACDACDWDRDTARYGRPMAIAGGVALACGVGILLWRFWPSAPEVSVGPSGVVVAGRF